MIDALTHDAMIAAAEAAATALQAASLTGTREALLAAAGDIAEAMERVAADAVQAHGFTPVPEMVDLATLIVCVSLARAFGRQELASGQRPAAARNPAS